MISPLQRIGRFASGALLLLPLLLASASAQDAALGADRTFLIRAGDTFEMAVIPQDREMQCGWVLTHDGAFVEAGQTCLFATRLPEPGMYLLNAEVARVGGENDRRVFILQVSPRGETPAPGVTDESALSLRVTSAPGIATVERTDVSDAVIGFDVDPILDSDSDGDSRHDDDLQGSQLRTRPGTLYLWAAFRGDDEKRVIAWQEGRPALDQEIRLKQSNQASQSVPVERGTIRVIRDLDGTVTLSYLPASETDLRQVVLLWSFGDGYQSLETTPTHRYGVDGDYQVTVTARRLSTGEVLGVAEQTVHIEREAEPIASSSSAASSVSSSPDETPVEGDGVSWFSLAALLSILPLLVGLLAAILLGILIMWILSKIVRRKGGGLQKRLEDAEARLLKKGAPTSAIDVPPPPMELKASEVVQEDQPPEESEQEREEPAAPAPTPSPEPQVNLDQAPSWLKKGLAADAETVSAPAATEAPSAPAPAPAEPTQQSGTDAEELPPWLQETQPAPAPSAPEPAAPVSSPAPPPIPDLPAPVPTSTPVSVPEPAPAVTEPAPTATDTPSSPAPSVNADSLPPWLQESPAAETADTQSKTETPSATTDFSAPASPSAPAPSSPAITEPTPPPAPITETPVEEPAPAATPVAPVESAVISAPASVEPASFQNPSDVPSPQPAETPAPEKGSDVSQSESLDDVLANTSQPSGPQPEAAPIREQTADTSSLLNEIGQQSASPAIPAPEVPATPSVPSPIPQPIPPASADDVKFMIRADGVNETMGRQDHKDEPV